MSITFAAIATVATVAAIATTESPSVSPRQQAQQQPQQPQDNSQPPMDHPNESLTEPYLRKRSMHEVSHGVHHPEQKRTKSFHS